MNNIIKLNQSNLKLLSSNVAIPQYNRSAVRATIAHIGVGGFHRSHQALYADRLISEFGVLDCGICGIGLMNHDLKIYNILKEQDCLYTLMTKDNDGSLEARVIGSIVEFLFAPEDPQAVIEKLGSQDIKVITLTVTEGGYNYNVNTGEFNFENPVIKEELANPKCPKTLFGYLTQALKLRKEQNRGGCTIQSCDNIQGNGCVLKKMLCSFIGKVDTDLLNWVKDNVAFPNSMVDRITPVTVEADSQLLKDKFQLEDKWPVVCEPFIQWVIEDKFACGRPAWEKVGATFVPDVIPYENMKLRLLNAGHSVLGILGALHGYDTIAECASDPDLSAFLRSYMDDEATPTLAKLDGFDLEAYKDSLIHRFQNTNIKDKVSRICCQSSAKIPKFMLCTVMDQLIRSGDVKRAALVVAAWCKYNEGVDEMGRSYQIDDHISERLVKAAKRSVADSMAFLQMGDVFGGLSKNEEFVKAYCQSLAQIRANKIIECVKQINHLDQENK